MQIPADSREVSLGIPAKPEYLVLVRLALSAVCRLPPRGPDEVAASVTASFRSATSSGPSDVSRHTADSASLTSTRYSGLAGMPSETSWLSAETFIAGVAWRLRIRARICIATGPPQALEAFGNL